MREATIHNIIAIMQDINNRRSIESFHESRGIFTVHCVCHRLALVLTDAIKGTKNEPKVIPEECSELLNSVYGYFVRSPARKKEMRYMIDLENNYHKEQAACRARRPDIVQLNPVEELERLMTSLEERHKLPRRVVLTRWLSSDDAIRVILNSRLVYINYFSGETSDAADEILERLEDSTIFAWYACLRDVIPVLTRMSECTISIDFTFATSVIPENKYCKGHTNKYGWYRWRANRIDSS